MRKTLPAILITLLFFTTHPAWAQWSVKLDGEYMLPIAGTQIDPYLAAGTGNYTGPLNGSYGSLAEGLAIGRSLDYTFKSNITVEIAGLYWHGFTQNYANVVVTPNTLFPPESYSITRHLHLFILSPTVFYNIKTKSKFTPYMGAGLDVTLDAKVKEKNTYNSSLPPDTNVNTTLSTTYNTTVGVNAQAGVSYKLSRHFNVFAGLRLDVLSLMPGAETINSETINGTAIDLSNEPASEKEIDYVKSFSAGANTNTNNPETQIGQRIPASAWGITLGLEYKFGSGKKKDK